MKNKIKQIIEIYIDADRSTCRAVDCSTYHFLLVVAPFDEVNVNLDYTIIDNIMRHVEEFYLSL